MFIAYSFKKLFSKHGIYHMGQIDLRMNRVSHADIEKIKNDLETNRFDNSLKYNFFYYSFLPINNFLQLDKKMLNTSHSDLQMLFKKSKLYSRNLIDRVNWLDKITFSRIEEIKQEVNFFFIVIV